MKTATLWLQSRDRTVITMPWNCLGHHSLVEDWWELVYLHSKLIALCFLLNEIERSIIQVSYIELLCLPPVLTSHSGLLLYSLGSSELLCFIMVEAIVSICFLMQKKHREWICDAICLGLIAVALHAMVLNYLCLRGWETNGDLPLALDYLYDQSCDQKSKEVTSAVLFCTYTHSPHSLLCECRNWSLGATR